MAELFGKALGNDVNRLIEIVAMILGVKIRPAQGEMNFDNKGVLGCLRAVMPNRDVRPDQIQSKVLKALNFLGNVRMKGRSKLNISWTDVNLHTQSYSRVTPMSNPERGFFPPIYGVFKSFFTCALRSSPTFVFTTMPF
jgi:hypothetical protein